MAVTDTIQGLFVKAGNTYKRELEKSMRANGQIVTGETLAQVKCTTTLTGLTVTAPRYIGVLQDGRGPGKMPPIAPIKRWLAKKGLPVGMAWGIARKTAARGSALFRGDARLKKPTDTFTQPIKPTLKIFSDELFKFIELELSGAVLKGFK